MLQTPSHCSIHLFIQINNVNLLRLPARDIYSYALSLVDVIFTKEELASSLLFHSSKSDKPALPKLGVDKVFGKSGTTNHTS